ncbi:hypothetical protein GGR51DRAFT_528100 [Nemania sp. FL0031]|nr:hypothetical protein GGR51DRAFT_528100 [Nemania sp. FL0031]
MGLFKHNRARSPAHEAGPSNPTPKVPDSWLKRLLRRSRAASDSSHSIEDNSPPTNHEDRIINASLWGRAYAALGDNEPDLVREYEELLLKEADKTGSASDSDPLPHDRDGDKRPQQAQLDSMIAKGLQTLGDRKTKYTIAGHEFVLSDQIVHAVELVLGVKRLIDEAVKLSPQASIAWAGVCIVLPLLTKPVTAREANLEGFAYVTARMRYYVELEPHFQRVAPALIARAEDSIVDLYCQFLDFQIRSVLRFYQNALELYAGDVIGKVDWEQKRQNIEKLEDTVNGNLEQITQLASREKLESISNTSAETLRVMLELLSVSKDQLLVDEEHFAIARRELEILEGQVKERLSDKQIACLQLFRLTSSAKDATYEWYKDRIEDRVDGTCEWFLDHENFQRWLEQDFGPLLVSADPGCGKSVLAKYLVDHRLPRSSTICYFFFKDEDQNTVRQALCALLHQLFLQNPSLIKHATDQYNKDGKGMIYSTKSLWTILNNAIRDPQAGSVIMVLDALDECAESEFENLIRNIEEQFKNDQRLGGRFKYILTSRPYDQIVFKFQHLSDAFRYIRIPGEEEIDAISREVNHVIGYRVGKLAAEKRLSSQVKTYLEEKLLEIEHRTYLWVYLVFDYLEKESFIKTREGVKSTMKTLPKNIDQAYEQILGKSKGDPMVRKALSIILVASRPLTVSEMKVALSIDNTSKSFYDLELDEEEEDFKERLRSWCGLFVSVHHGKLYFLHQTAREFLSELPPPADTPPEACWQHSITSCSAHKILAEICVTYLRFLNFDTSPTDESTKTDQSAPSDILLDYAAKFWGAHFLKADVSDDAAIVSSAFEIYEPNSKSYWTWSQVYWDTKYDEDDETVPSLIVSSRLGHEAIVKLLLENGADIEDKDTEYADTPLIWAAEKGHEAVVKLLLENGANTEAKYTESGQTPLIWAVEKGHEAIVKLLLKNGVNIEAKDTEYGRTPLSWAAEKGHGVVVTLLLKKGADVETKDNFGRTPLSYAEQGGHQAVVKLLESAGS